MGRKVQPQEIVGKLIDELSKLPDHPRVLVTVSHCYLELLVHLLAVHRCKDAKRIESSSRDYPHSVKIVILHEAGIITDRWAEILHQFRKLRNTAAHEVQFSLTPDDLSVFAGAEWKSGMPLTDPNNFRYLCIEVVVGLWNAHVDVFAPLFQPELFAKSG